jgi:hypothetical protein
MSEPKTKEKLLADSIRRVLYLSKLLEYNCGDLKKLEACKSNMAYVAKQTEDKLRWLYREWAYVVPAKTWEIVRMDMERDELHDISMLLDAVALFKDVSLLTTEITGFIKEAQENKQHDTQTH